MVLRYRNLAIQNPLGESGAGVMPPRGSEKQPNDGVIDSDDENLLIRQPIGVLCYNPPMKLLALGSLLCALVTMVACVAPDPTVPVPAATPTPAAITSTALDAIEEAHPEGGSDRSQEEVIDLSPSVTDSSMYADVGDVVVVQVDVSGHSGCKDLKVRDPFGNVVAELAPKGIRNGFFGVQFRGAFFAAADGEYTVEFGPESENLSCNSRSSPARAEVKWTVQPR